MRATLQHLFAPSREDVSISAPVQLVGRGTLRDILRLVRRWRERERLRLELSLMRPRDFGDLAVPPGLVVDEVRKWPWQQSGPNWGEIRSADSRGASGEARAEQESARAGPSYR
jgi:uncharacterized protein YjiS (DUF1127 family)